MPPIDFDAATENTHSHHFILDTPFVWIKHRKRQFHVANGRHERVLTVDFQGTARGGDLQLEVFLGDSDVGVCKVHQLSSPRGVRQFSVKSSGRDLAIVQTKRAALSSRGILSVRRLDLADRSAADEVGFFGSVAAKVAKGSCSTVLAVLLLLLLPVVGLAVLAAAVSFAQALLVLGLPIALLLVPVLLTMLMTGRIGSPYLILFDSEGDGPFAKVSHYTGRGYKLSRIVPEGDLTLLVLVTVLRRLGAIAKSKSDSDNPGLKKFGWDMRAHLLLSPLNMPPMASIGPMQPSLRAGMGPYSKIPNVTHRAREFSAAAIVAIGTLALEIAGIVWLFGLQDPEQRAKVAAWFSTGRENAAVVNNEVGVQPSDTDRQVNDVSDRAVVEPSVQAANDSAASESPAAAAADDSSDNTGAPIPDHPAVREWTDSTGRFRVQAIFLGLKNETIQLRRIDGKEFSLPIGRLCAADRTYAEFRARLAQANTSADDDEQRTPSHRQQPAMENGTESARVWTDSTGGSQVTATFIDADKDNVRLKRTDGREISVPIMRLSGSDREYIQARLEPTPPAQQ